MYKSTTRATWYQTDTIRVNIFSRCIISPVLPGCPFTRFIVLFFTFVWTAFMLKLQIRVSRNIRKLALKGLENSLDFQVYNCRSHLLKISDIDCNIEVSEKFKVLLPSKGLFISAMPMLNTSGVYLRVYSLASWSFQRESHTPLVLGVYVDSNPSFKV